MKNYPIANVNKSADRKLLFIFSIGAALIITINYLFVFVFPGHLKPDFIFTRTWGFHFASYYAVPWRIAIYVVLLSACLPPVSGFAARIGRILYRGISRSLKKQTLFIVLSLLSVVFFRIFRCKYGLLGDNFVRVNDIVHNNFIWHDSGTIFVLHYFYRALHALLGLNGAQALVLATNIGGAVYVYCALAIADALGDSPFRKTALFAVMAVSPLVQLFFGYLEITAPVYVLLTLHLYASVWYVKGEWPVIVPALALACAIAFCLAGLFFVPAFIFILWCKGAVDMPLLKKQWVIGLCAVSAICLAWYPARRFIVPDCLPMVPNADNPMALFSAKRLWEYFNGLVLALGAGTILLPALLGYAYCKRNKFDIMTAFLVVESAVVAAGLLVFNEILGSGDADIYSVIAIIGPLALMAVFLRLFDSGISRNPARHGAFIFAVFLAMHTALYVGINASDKSIARIKDIHLPDPAGFYIRHPAPMVLGIMFDRNGLKEEVAAMFTKSYESDSLSPRNVCIYINTLVRRNDLEKALPLAIDLADKNPNYYPGLRALYQVARKQGNTQLAFSALERMYHSYVNNAATTMEIFGPYGVSEDLSALIDQLITLHRYHEADTVCQTLRTFCPLRDYSDFLSASIQYYLGNDDSCIALCAPLVDKREKNHKIYLLCAQAWQDKHNSPVALGVLHQGLALISSAEGRAALMEEIQVISAGKQGK